MKKVPAGLTILVAVIVTLAAVDSASAMYHPGLGRMMQRDPNGMQGGPSQSFAPRDQYRGGMNLYQYVSSNSISRLDPSGLEDYEIGHGPRPSIQWDNGYAYDPNADPTASDYAYWYGFGFLQFGGSTSGTIPDATRAYAHYRGASGGTLHINYDKAIGDDSKIATGFDNELAGAQADIERLHDGVTEKFHVHSKAARLVNADTQNWQKALGGHRIWGDGDVVYDPVACEYTLTIFVEVEDFYNFNAGQSDIATGLPDSINGRFEVYGWAKSFYSRDIVERTITWNRGDIPDTTEVDGEPRRRDRGRRNSR